MVNEKKGLDMSSFFGVGAEKNTTEKSDPKPEKKKDTPSKKNNEDKSQKEKLAGSKKNSGNKSKNEKTVPSAKSVSRKTVRVSNSVSSEEYVNLIGKISPSEIDKMAELLDKTTQQEKVNSLVQVDEDTKQAFNKMKDVHKNRFKSGLVNRSLEVYFSLVALIDEYGLDTETDILSVVNEALKDYSKK